MLLFRTAAVAARGRSAVRAVVLPGGRSTTSTVAAASRHGELFRRLAARRAAGLPIPSKRCFSNTSTDRLPMKPGTPIPGLTNIYPTPKDPSAASSARGAPPVASKREDYPAWVNDLTRPLPTLAKLRTMKVEDASDKDMKRYLKLVRKAKIKSNNESRSKS
jgi:hypothetical protein